MQNILDYFNTFLSVIFDSSVRLYTPAQVIAKISSFDITSGLDGFFVNLLHSPEYFLSYFVWFWFAWLSFKLLLVVPYKFFKGLFRK